MGAKPGDGLFLPSCLSHKVNKKSIVQGFNYFQGLGDWFAGRGDVPAILVDDCTMAGPGLPCNPTCSNVLSGDGCKDTVLELCNSADAAECDLCAHNHRSKLIQAGCKSRHEVAKICSGDVAGLV